MIFNKAGVPLGEALISAALWAGDNRRTPRPKRPRVQRYTGAILRAIRAARGVGRPLP